MGRLWINGRERRLKTDKRSPPTPKYNPDAGGRANEGIFRILPEEKRLKKDHKFFGKCRETPREIYAGKASSQNRACQTV